MNASKTIRRALAIVCYDRPHYLASVVASIATNPFLPDCDVFVFQDAAPRGVALANEIVCRSLPVAEMIVRVGTPHLERHSVDVREHLFDRLGYDVVFYLEDDVVLGRHCLRLTNQLLQWAIGIHPHLGTVSVANIGPNQSCNNACAVRDRLSRVSAHNGSWFYYCQNQDAWNAISPYMYEYRDRFLTERFSDLPVQAIAEWIKGIVREHADAARMSYLPETHRETLKREISEYLALPAPVGQDAITHGALLATGQAKIATVVNRVQYIGREGTHDNPAWLFQHSLDEFDEDECISEFEWE